MRRRLDEAGRINFGDAGVRFERRDFVLRRPSGSRRDGGARPDGRGDDRGDAESGGGTSRD